MNSTEAIYIVKRLKQFASELSSRLRQVSPELVVKALGITRPRIYEWLAKYREGGLDALRSRKARGCPSKLQGKDFYDIYKDPKEEHGVMAQLLWAWVSFDDFTRLHTELIEKFPHREPYRSVLEE